MNDLKTPWGLVPAGTILSPEWAWILQHASLIEKHAWKVVDGTPIDVDDARGALIIDLATHFHQFDPDRGTAVTFIWMRHKKVRRTMVREGVRSKTLVAPLSDNDETPAYMRGSAFRMTARAEVAVAIKRCDRTTQVALLSIARDWDARTVRHNLDCTLKARDARVRSLAKEPQ